MAHLSGQCRGKSKKLAALARALALEPTDDKPDTRQLNPAVAGLLAKLGPQPGGAVPQEDHFLWPCNVIAWHHWGKVQTQWRAGMGGTTGLDYAGLRAYLEAQKLPDQEHAHVWACITACEHATLRAWEEKANAKKPPQG